MKTADCCTIAPTPRVSASGSSYSSHTHTCDTTVTLRMWGSTLTAKAGSKLNRQNRWDTHCHGNNNFGITAAQTEPVLPWISERHGNREKVGQLAGVMGSVKLKRHNSNVLETSGRYSEGGEGGNLDVISLHSSLFDTAVISYWYWIWMTSREKHEQSSKRGGGKRRRKNQFLWQCDRSETNRTEVNESQTKQTHVNEGLWVWMGENNWPRERKKGGESTHTINSPSYISLPAEWPLEEKWSREQVHGHYMKITDFTDLPTPNPGASNTCQMHNVPFSICARRAKPFCRKAIEHVVNMKMARRFS